MTDTRTVAALRETAIAALTIAVQKTRKTGYEYGGLIFKSGKGFRFSQPATSKDKVSVDPFLSEPDIAREAGIDVKVGVYIDIQRARSVLRKYGFVSIYHTHPCLDMRTLEPLETDNSAKYASPEDMGQMTLTQIERAYIGISCTGEVRELTLDLPPLFPFGGFTPAVLGPIIGHVPL